MDSQKTPHTSPLRASYGVSLVSLLEKRDHVIKWHNIPNCMKEAT